MSARPKAPTDDFARASISLVAAPALGIALAAHADRPFSPTAVIPMVFWTLVCLTAAMAGAERRGPDDWRARHEADETARTERLKEFAGRN
jgi:hypothetical protein